MRPPTKVKEVWKLTGWIASVGRFVPKSADRCAEFFKFEKFVLTMIISARHLRSYFDAHQVIVLTDLPLRSIL